MLTTRPRPIPCNSCTWGCSGHRWQGRHHGITIPIRWDVPTPKACISYIRRSLAMSDSALSLYPGNSQSVEDSLPQTWDHIALTSPPVGCTHTAKQNRQRKDRPEYFCTFRLQDAQALKHQYGVNVMTLACQVSLWDVWLLSTQKSFCKLAQVSLHWSAISICNLTAACPYPRVFV